LELPGAILSFHWKFEEISEWQTRLRQGLVLSGENAKSFVAHARVLEQTAPQGMVTLVAAIELAYESTRKEE
jgi:hypothetical protein